MRQDETVDEVLRLRSENEKLRGEVRHAMTKILEHADDGIAGSDRYRIDRLEQIRKVVHVFLSKP